MRTLHRQTPKGRTDWRDPRWAQIHSIRSPRLIHCSKAKHAARRFNFDVEPFALTIDGDIWLNEIAGIGQPGVSVQSRKLSTHSLPFCTTTFDQFVEQLGSGGPSSSEEEGVDRPLSGPGEDQTHSDGQDQDVELGSGATFGSDESHIDLHEDGGEGHLDHE